MRAFTIKEAKAKLNELVEAASNGEDIVLMRGSEHVAAIIPISEAALELVSRVTDAQAANFWRAVKAESAETFSSIEAAVVGLQKTHRTNARTRRAKK
jgi:prevent-host-death family protein